MALLRRVFCWKLRTATFVVLICTFIMALEGLLLRLLDIGAYISSDFEISQGFEWPWKSHQWQAFLASDIIVSACHLGIMLFVVFMLYMVTQEHFVLYMEKMRSYTYTFIMYIFIELCFSVFQYSFYGLNTFRLSFVVFAWLSWLLRSLAGIGFVVILFSRMKEMEDDMAYELRVSDKKYVHSYA